MNTTINCHNVISTEYIILKFVCVYFIFVQCTIGTINDLRIIS